MVQIGRWRLPQKNLLLIIQDKRYQHDTPSQEIKHEKHLKITVRLVSIILFPVWLGVLPYMANVHNSDGTSPENAT